MAKTYRFPPAFYWGAATSGEQSEGNFGKCHENVMDYWFRTAPEDFFQGVGPDVASDFFHRYRDDLRQLKEIGLNSFRTSIQWSRLIKDFETGEVDEAGHAFYAALISEAKKQGLELFLVLNHFDLPAELQHRYGGWESRHVVDLFERYAQTVFSLFGDQVRFWGTFNEPMVIAEAGYLYGQHYPKYKNKGKEAMQVLYHLNLASARAIRAYRAYQAKSGNQAGKIGIVLNVTPVYPKDSSEAHVQAAQVAEAVFNKSFLDPAVKGVFPAQLVALLEKDGVLWESQPGDAELLQTHRVDFLGINYYHPKRVQAPPAETRQGPWMPDWYFADYDWPQKRMNPHRGWEIYPEALYDVAVMIRDAYGNVPWYVAENGMGVEGEDRCCDANGQIQDDDRIAFYQEHLEQLARGIEAGSHCFGYHVWAAMDCWSWNNAYKNRYGLLAVDLATQERTKKKSAEWFRQLTEKNEFTKVEEGYGTLEMD